MYLPEKVTKILTKMSLPYTIHYRGNKIAFIESEENKVKIYATSTGCRVDVRGSSINLRDLNSLEHLLIKFNIIEKAKGKVKVTKLKEEISDLFSNTDKEIAIKYRNANMECLLLKDHNIRINRTEFGYRVRMGSKEIAAENINSIRVLLEKMNIIPIVIKKKERKKKVVLKENELMPGVEQLTLGI